MSIWLAELQRAIYERLNGNVPCDVHNAVPPEPAARAPYVAIGAEITELPGDFETQDSDGSETTTYVHAWDDSRGTLRLVRIMAEVDKRLHDALLNLGGVATAHLRRDFTTVLREQPDDDARFWSHGTIRYRCWVHGVAAPTK